MIREDWFPTPIWYKNNLIEDYEVSQLIEFCYKFNNENQEGRQISNSGGWQSNFVKPEVFVSNGLGFFIKKVDEEMQKVFKEFSSSLDKIKMDSFWININKETNYNIEHSHPNTVFSLVFYLTDGSNIVFKRPHGDMDYFLRNTIVADSTDTLNWKLITYTPKPNMLLIFPGFLLHYVEPQAIGKDRISITCNYLV